MKKYLSVFMLYVRSSFLRLLLIMAAMAAAELLLFEMAAGECMRVGRLALEEIVEKSHISIVMAAAFVLISAQLSSMGCEFGSRQGYTLRRLSVSEKGVFIMQAAFNALGYFLLWGFQTLLAVLLCKHGAEKLGDMAGNQSIFLAFYRNAFLHNLLSLSEWTGYLRNFCLVAALGLAAALFSYNQRRKKMGIAIVFMLSVAVLSFAAGTGELAASVIEIIICISVALWCFYKVYVGVEENEN